MKKTSKTIKQLGRMLAVVMVLCLLLGMMATGSFAVNEKVQEVSKGVLQFIMTWTDADGFEWYIGTGTAFLINENTIVTCQHCTDLHPWTVIGSYTMQDYFPEIGRMTVQEFENRIHYYVTVTRDVKIGAKMIEFSEEMDWAILQLDRSLRDRQPITLRASASVETTEDVYAVGFPALVERTQDVSYMTADDVTISDGRVTKSLFRTDMFTGANADYIQTSCKLTGGISGGPLVDENGYAIGLCSNMTGANIDFDYFYAVCIDQVRTVLDSYGIEYKLADSDSTPAETTAEPVEAPVETPETEAAAPLDYSALDSLLDSAKALKEGDFNEDSYAVLANAISEAENLKNSSFTEQKDIDNAVNKLTLAMEGLKEKNFLDNTLLVIIIAIAAAIIIAVIVLVLILSNKKKKAAAEPSPAPRPMAPPVTPAAGAQQKVPAGVGAPVGGFAPSQMNVAQPTRPSTVALTPEAGATTVLSQGAGETTVLSQSVKGGTLIRKKNGERIEINKNEVILGRERNRVTYCISDNTSIGRVHAKVVVRDGVSYLVDLNSTNGTFVNGAKSTPNQEVALKNGDTVTLADEAFEFKA